MAQQVIGVGTVSGDGTGDPGRTAFTKVNANFSELYAGRISGALLSYTSPTGGRNDVNPAGFGSTVARLEVTLTANTNWTGLLAGVDGQQLVITQVAGAFTFTLNALNGGSQAANQFRAVGDLALAGVGDSVLLCYYGGSVNKWVVL
jgi:hypothetical protein